MSYKLNLITLTRKYPGGKITRFKSRSNNALDACLAIYEYLRGVTVARQFVNKHYYDFLSCPANNLVVEVGGSNKLHESLGFSNNIKSLDIVPSSDIDICEDVENLSFSDASIDRFVCISVLEHVQNPGKAISEMLRCLKPGGEIILSVPWMFEMHMEPRDYYRYTLEGIVLLSSGARIVKVFYSNGYLGLLAHFLQKSIVLRYLMGSLFYVCSWIEKPSARFASQVHLILEKPSEAPQSGK
jgi:SAM-dependent methyltransferase